MFRNLYNQARILLRIEPVTGLLIKSGKEPADPTRPAMEFIRMFADVGGDVREMPYIPGSSLKGVIRSHAERIFRTLGLIQCDITQERGACVAGREAEHPPYCKHCLICRTFGYTTLGSHIRFLDALPWKPDDEPMQRQGGAEAIRIEQRPGVQIDRRMGTGSNPREHEVVTGGAFYAEIVIRNYQLWQLALLVFILRDLNEGYQRVGAMKSRGLGRVRITVDELLLEQGGLLGDSVGKRVRGIGDIEHLIGPYDLIGSDEIETPSLFVHQVTTLLRSSFTVDSGSNAESAWQELGKAISESAHWQRLMRRRVRKP